MINKAIFEPIAFYKEELEGRFQKRIEEDFKVALESSGIDVEANQKAVAAYREGCKEKEGEKRSLKWIRRANFLILPLLAFFAFGIFQNIRASRLGRAELDELILLRNGAAILGLLSFHFFYLKRKKRERAKRIEEQELRLLGERKACEAAMEPLVRLFEDALAKRHIGELLPELKLNSYFTLEDYAEMVECYGLAESLGENSMAVDLFSGQIFGNPFLILKKRERSIIEEEYWGSRRVSWSERGSDGKRRRESQLLRACIRKPKPIYEESIELYYGHEAAEKLNFYREPGFVHEMDEKNYRKHKERQKERLEAKGEAALAEGRNFVEMGNADFDAIFGAWDRDQETDFRLLFPASSQEAMMKLLEDKDFGDDFFFQKRGKMNRIWNGKDFLLNIPREAYASFDFAEVKESFFALNQACFENFYKLFLPILAIAVYHEESELGDYSPKKNYACYYNPYSREVLASREGGLAHKDSTTPVILKTKFLEDKEKSEVFEVEAKSYRAVEHVEKVRKRAGNGRYYDVPVHWFEYLPLEAVSRLEIAKKK